VVLVTMLLSKVLKPLRAWSGSRKMSKSFASSEQPEYQVDTHEDDDEPIDMNLLKKLAYADSQDFRKVIKPKLSEETSSTSSSSITSSSSSAGSEDDDSVIGISQDFLLRQLSDLCRTLSGRNRQVDELLHWYEKVAEVIVSCKFHEEGRVLMRVKFHILDPSSVPPPDVRIADSTFPVQALMQMLIRAKDSERRVKSNPESLKVLAELLANFRPSDAPSVDEFLKSAFSKLCDLEDKEGMFDDEILSRLSSMIRYNLRLALNPASNFSPIVLASAGRPARDDDDDGLDVKDVPNAALNVAFLFHRALNLTVQAGQTDSDQPNVEAALKFRSAKKFVNNVLHCVERIKQVDNKRTSAWQSAQRWALELGRLFPEEYTELALIAEPKQLLHLAHETSLAEDIALIESHRTDLQTKRAVGRDLRSSRVAVTGLCGKNGLFPEIKFVLDI